MTKSDEHRRQRSRSDSSRASRTEPEVRPGADGAGSRLLSCCGRPWPEPAVRDEHTVDHPVAEPPWSRSAGLTRSRPVEIEAAAQPDHGPQDTATEPDEPHVTGADAARVLEAEASLADAKAPTIGERERARARGSGDPSDWNAGADDPESRREAAREAARARGIRTCPDAALVAMVREGSRVAADELLERFGPQLERRSRRLLGQRLRSQYWTFDVFNLAFIEFRRMVNERRVRASTPGEACNLLMTIANRRVAELGRTYTVAQKAEAAAAAGERRDDDGTGDRADRPEVWERLDAWLLTLDSVDQAILRFRGLEDRKHGTIAAALDLSEDAIRKRWQHIRTEARALRA